MISHEKEVTVILEQAVLTMPNVFAYSKEYDGTDATTIMVADGNQQKLQGILSYESTDDNVLVNEEINGIFASKNVGGNIAVTTTEEFTLTGIHAKYYTLTQPTGLTANISAAPLNFDFDTLSTTDRDYIQGNKNVDVTVKFESEVDGETLVQGRDYTVTATMDDDSAGIDKVVDFTAPHTVKNLQTLFIT